MTPKEMAQSLVNEFDGVGLQMRNEAIACALICVKRIVKEIQDQLARALVGLLDKVRP